MTPFILLGIGLLLIFLEFYLPGGVMGVLGAIFVLASIVTFIMQTESIIFIILYLVAVTAIMIALFRFALWRIRHAKPGYSIYSDRDQEGYYASKYDETAVGKSGVAVSDLHPGGHVTVDGKKYHAISQSGYIEKGSKILVAGGEGESLLVKIKGTSEKSRI